MVADDPFHDPEPGERARTPPAGVATSAAHTHKAAPDAHEGADGAVRVTLPDRPPPAAAPASAASAMDSQSQPQRQSHPDPNPIPIPAPAAVEQTAAQAFDGRRDASPVRKRSRHAHFNLASLSPLSRGEARARAPLGGAGDLGVIVPPAPDHHHGQGQGQSVMSGADLAHVNDALEDYRTHAADATSQAQTRAQYPRVDSSTSVTSMLRSEDNYDYRHDKDLAPDRDEHGDEHKREGGHGRHADGEMEHSQDQDKDKDKNHATASGRATENQVLNALLGHDASAYVRGGYVQLGETDGLPSRPPDSGDEDDDESGRHHHLRAAVDLVRSHTGTGSRHQWSALRRRVRSGSVAANGHDRDAPEAAAHGVSTATDIEKQQPLETQRKGKGDDNEGPANPPLKAPPGVSGNSVLSSLLALYGQPPIQDSTMTSGATSAATSTATTPMSSRPPSPSRASGEHTPPAHRVRFWHNRTHSPSSSAPATAMGTGAGATGKASPSRMEKRKSHSQTSIADRDPEEDAGWLGAFARQFDRPKAARSGGGVFGALVQNTTGMSAPAVPAASTLMPAAKRPGYHLTRYSLAEEPPSPRFKPPSRPSSTPGVRPGSDDNGRVNGEPRSGTVTPTHLSRPASVATLGWLRDDAGPASRPASVAGSDLGHAKSSDNLLMMKGRSEGTRGEKRRRPIPSALNLKAVKSAETWLTGKSAEDLRAAAEEEKRRKEMATERRRQKKARDARKKQEVFIVKHVAAIIARQRFILKLGRALMMFGSPTHRIETQIQATAKVLDINAQVVYLPGIMLISFADDTMLTSETKFLKQASTLDLGKLLSTHNLYWEVVHDRLSVEDASTELDRLMTCSPLYAWWQMVVIGAFCSAIIIIPSYYGSLVDALMTAPLGMLLIIVQMFAAKNDLFSGVFEIVIATFISFLAAALSDTGVFCYTALVSGGIVMILPGYIVLTGALEIASRNITAGAVHMGYSVIYSLFLGFGISMGAEIYMKIRHRDYVTNATDYTCTATHRADAPWYMQRPSSYWYYLCVPAFSFFLSLANYQPIFRKEMPIMMALACAGWVTNFFSARIFPGRSDIISAVGSFCVGILGNIYGRLTNGASFPVMVTGILMQLPSGLKEGGLFNFAADTKNGTFSQYSSGFSVAAQLISVAIGLTVGLFVSAVLTNPFGGSRRRGAGIFSF